VQSRRLRTLFLVGVVMVGCDPSDPTTVSTLHDVPAASCRETGTYETVIDPSLQARIDAYLQPRAAANEFFGSVLVARGCTVVADAGYGAARLPTLALPETAPTHDTTYHVGSITKAMTAVAVLILRDRGLLRLDDPIHLYVPQFPTTGGKAAVTIHDLLSHRSGIPDYIAQQLDYQRPDPFAKLLVPWTDAQILSSFASEPLAFAPDSGFDYSNSNYFLLGLVIEAVSGVPFATFLEDNVFAPLAMSRTHVGCSDNEAASQGLIRFDREVSPVPGAFTLPQLLPGPDMDFSLLHAAGGVCSTPWDLMLFVSSLTSTKLLSAESRDLLLTPYSVFDESLGLWYGYGVGLADASSPIGVGRWHSGSSHTYKNMWFQIDDSDTILVIDRNISQFEYVPTPGAVLGRVVKLLPLDDVELELIKIVRGP